jgi:DNA-directed RNA polymerase specialized sigma24 family protein
MTQTELTAAIASHLDALHNLAAWLARDAVDAQALVQATCRQALRMIPPTTSRNKSAGWLVNYHVGTLSSASQIARRRS